MAQSDEEEIAETQAYTESQRNAEIIQSQILQSQPLKMAWGVLLSKRAEISSVDLRDEKFSVGRGEDNDLYLTTDYLPFEIIKRVSKIHFQICRDLSNPLNPVYLQNLSRNGTFVNNQWLSANKRRILMTGDIIALHDKSTRLFTFRDLSPNAGLVFPAVIKEKYYVSRKLGSGACGTVDLVYHWRTCQQYALKTVKKNFLETSNIRVVPNRNTVMNEAKILLALNHPCVVQMCDIFDTKDSLFMILEFMEGGDLLKRINNSKRLSEKNSKLFFYQMCHAVRYLHSKGISHRDLKPDNILLKSSDEETLLKVSDFGLSKLVNDDSVMRTLCGTPFYVAPEILSAFDSTGHTSYTKRVDIWSLGVILFTCLSGTFPFSNNGKKTVSDQIKAGTFNFSDPSWTEISSVAKHLIRKMLTVDPKERPSIDDVLNHMWLLDGAIIDRARDLMGIPYENEDCLGPPRKRMKNV